MGLVKFFKENGIDYTNTDIGFTDAEYELVCEFINTHELTEEDVQTIYSMGLDLTCF